MPKETYTADLRMSTAPGTDGLLIGPLEVRGKMRTYFSEVALWQDIGLGDDDFYSIYFKFYNGGDLLDLHERYHNELLPVPESFTVRYLQRGVIPGTDDEPEEWTPIYHRDIAMNNIFIHYPERPHSERAPRMGFEENAFPELVLGDFGQGGIHGDHVDTILGGRWSERGLEEWHDTYAIFSVVKELCLTHIHYEHHYGDTPEGIDCDEINGFMTPEHVPYSDDLFNVLRQWEYPNCKNSTIDNAQENGEEVVRNATLVPDLDEIVNDILPIARNHVQRFRAPRVDLRLDYYRSIDVSWTKPRRLMPYHWIGESLDTIQNKDEDDDSQHDDSQDNSGDQPNNADDLNTQGDDQNNGGEGGQDQDNGDEDNGDEDDEPINIEDESTDIIDNHKCPEPGPDAIKAKLKPLRELENKYPRYRRPHQRVMLHYRRPVMMNPKYPPNQPLRGIPPSPTPTASSSLSVIETPSTPSGQKSSTLSSLETMSTPSGLKDPTTAAPEGGGERGEDEDEEEEEEEREEGEVLVVAEEEAAQDKAEVLLRLEDSRHEDVTSEGSTHSNDRIRNFDFLEPPL
ncbi:hypothetical protein EV127DRAFT_411455 [Xylaria flabelliformis]|nr:hypothetical protein EV127DRAFT_411455 [Xylaria flabelliformis]